MNCHWYSYRNGKEKVQGLGDWDPFCSQFDRSPPATHTPPKEEEGEEEGEWEEEEECG